MADLDPLALTLSAIARLERQGGVRDTRLTEPNHQTWLRFRRRLGWRDFLAILHEDLAGPFPLPFDLGRWSRDPLEGLSHEYAKGLIDLAQAPDERTPGEFLSDACQSLGLETGGALSDIIKIEPRHRVLELPGSGGRIAATIASKDSTLSFGSQFTFVADTDADRIAVGLATVELRANPPTVITSAQAQALLSQPGRFDHVFGLKRSRAAVAMAPEGARLL